MQPFNRFIARLAEARSLDELRDAMQEVSRTIGLDTFAYVHCDAARHRSPDHLGNSLIVAASTTGHTVPPTVGQRWLSTVVDRASSRPLPFFEEWKGAGPGASRTALIVPVHDNLPGRLAVAAFASRNKEPVDTTLRSHEVVLHAISIYLHAHASRLTDPAGPSLSTALTSRELQCLQWAARGKSRTDIGQILGLSPRTIKFHLENARYKLGAAHTRQAVLKAAMLGLITANQVQAQRCLPDVDWHLPWQRYPGPGQPIRTTDA